MRPRSAYRRGDRVNPCESVKRAVSTAASYLDVAPNLSASIPLDRAVAITERDLTTGASSMSKPPTNVGRDEFEEAYACQRDRRPVRRVGARGTYLWV